MIAGRARGVRLVGGGEAVRPLGDRLKEGLFAILEPQLREARVLDLFAGSGAGGIEALSRGAGGVTFVEAAGPAIEAIERNLRAARLDRAAATVARGDALAWLASARPERAFDVVLVDPPYDRPDLLLEALEMLGGVRNGASVVAVDGVVAAKHSTRTRLPERIGLLASIRERRFGDSAITFYRWRDDPEAR